MNIWFNDCRTDTELEQRFDQIVQHHDAVTERNAKRLDEISDEFIRRHSVIPVKDLFTNDAFYTLNRQIEAQRRHGNRVFGIIQVVLIVAAIIVILSVLY